MDERLEKNKALWNALTGPHVKSEFYDMAGFKAGRDWLRPLEIEEMGDVSGKSLLHLQCHFGLDTLAWGRRGANVTGVDFSEESIDNARKLSRENGIDAEFICSDIYALPEALKKEFDIVFISYGVLAWLPDLKRWAEIITHFLKPGGFFYIAEIHPMLITIGYQPEPELKVKNPYFQSAGPERCEGGTDYPCGFTHKHVSYQLQWPVSSVITALSRTGLHIEYLHEFPFLCFQVRKDMYRDQEGWWRLEGDKIPLTFSIKATKPN